MVKLRNSVIADQVYLSVLQLIICISQTLTNFGNFLGILQGYKQFPFVKSNLKKNFKLALDPPRSKGDPCFLGHTFIYEIFIHERYSHVVRFFDKRYVCIMRSELTIKKKPINITVTRARMYHIKRSISSIDSLFSYVYNFPT